MSGDSGVQVGTHTLRLNAVGRKIRDILIGLSQGLFQTAQPFSIGKVEKRMKSFAERNNIQLASDEIYMSVKRLSHAERPTKRRDNMNVGIQALSEFPQKRRSMKLYYDTTTGNFTYTDFRNKFIISPNYELKINKVKTKKVNFVTSDRVRDAQEFGMQKYIRV